jgi:protocatechuate 3,4-dioxygenase beta subunit
MRVFPILLVAAATLAACGGTAADPGRSPGQAREPILGGGEGCEAVFDGLPDSLGWSAVIAGPTEPGARLVIDGTVRDGDGRPAPGIIVYAYHTDDRGVYPPDERAREIWGRRHGRLRAWVRTDGAGRYRFETIRPAGYPDTDIPAHVHMHVLEPGRGTYYIEDIHFDDDPRLTPAHRRQVSNGRGGPGLLRPVREGNGPWRVTRDIVLGRNIPGYPAATREEE